MSRMLLIVLFALLNLGLVQAQESTSEVENSTPAQTEDASNTCNPAELNWCFAGQPWGDGRCDSPDPAVTAYNYRQGFYQAAAACGVIDSAPSATFFDDDGAFSISCRAVQRGDDEIELSANWSRRIKNQSRLVFRFDVELASGDTNNGESPTVGSFDTSVSTTRTYDLIDQPIDLKSATAYLIDGFDNPITDVFNCAVEN